MKYNVESIVVNSLFDGIRKSVGMYIGSNDQAGLHHLIKEVISNSVDEHLNGYCDTVEVKLLEGHGIMIKDNGRGIPIGKLDSGISALEACLTLLHTGGKDNNGGEGAGYNTAGGEHGTGTKCVNALSDKLIAITTRDHQQQTLEFIDGEVKKDTTKNIKTDDHGFSMSFWPSLKYLETNEVDINWLKEYLHQQSLLNKGLKFILTAGDDNYTYYSEHGINDYMDELTSGKVMVVNPTELSYSKDGCKLNILFGYTGDYTPTYKLFTNNIPQESGTHLTGFKTTFTRIMNKYANDNNMIKGKEGNLSGSDYEEGLVVILTLFMDGRVVYKGQHKEELNDTRAKNFVMEGVAAELESLCLNDSKTVKLIITRALNARKARAAADKAKEVARGVKTKVSKAIDLPTKLVDANPRDKDRSKCELYIVEGDSAGNGLITKRDGQTQGIMPLRGKILSVRKATVADMFKNQEIDNIVKSLGLKVNPTNYTLEYDLKKLRYHKLIIATDADNDGAHICNLLITLLWRLCPELIIKGHLYKALPPLYKVITKKNEYIFLEGDAELNDYKKKHKGDFIVTRNKGLGEQSPDELAKCILRETTRNIIQLNTTDVQLTDNTLEVFMGDGTDDRRNYYIDHWND